MYETYMGLRRVAINLSLGISHVIITYRLAITLVH